MDYTTLIGDKETEGSIKNWLNHSLIPSDQVIDEAEQWIYERLRVRQMIKAATGTFQNSDNGVLTLPTDYRAPILLQFTGTNRLFPEFNPEIGEVERAWSFDGDGNRTTGAPTQWGTNATQIVFDTYAPSGTTYAYRLLYYSTPTALGPSNATNFLTDRYARMFRTVLMGIGYEFQEDDKRAVQYLTKAEALLREVEVEKDLEFMGADIQMGIP